MLSCVLFGRVKRWIMRNLRTGYYKTKRRSPFLAGCSLAECVSPWLTTVTHPPSTRHWPESHTVSGTAQYWQDRDQAAVLLYHWQLKALLDMQCTGKNVSKRNERSAMFLSSMRVLHMFRTLEQFDKVTWVKLWDRVTMTVCQWDSLSLKLIMCKQFYILLVM